MMTQTPSVFALPAFWRGASYARAELLTRHDPRYNSADAVSLRYHAAIGAHEAIAVALEGGTALEDIPEFRTWIGRDTRTPTEVANDVDCLDIVRQ